MSGATLLLAVTAAIISTGALWALGGVWWALALYCASTVAMMVLVLRP
jgi:hypothetical protein